MTEPKDPWNQRRGKGPRPMVISMNRDIAEQVDAWNALYDSHDRARAATEAHERAEEDTADER